MHHFFSWFIANTNLDKILMCLVIVSLIEIAFAPKLFPLKKASYNYALICTMMTAEIAVRWVIITLTGKAASYFGGPFIDLTRRDHWSVFTQLYAAASFLLVFDFFYYWHHRLMHKYAFFWQAHKLHHAEEHMNGSSAFVNHWTDDMLRAVTVYVPMAVLFKFEPIVVWWFSVAVTFHVIFTHINIRVPLGPLTPFINGPQFHRIHHTNEAERIDKNFSFYFPFWDFIFGTYEKPRTGDHVPTGLVSGEKITGLWQAHIHPFVGWYQMIRASLCSNKAATEEAQARKQS